MESVWVLSFTTLFLESGSKFCWVKVQQSDPTWRWGRASTRVVFFQVTSLPSTYIHSCSDWPFYTCQSTHVDVFHVTYLRSMNSCKRYSFVATCLFESLLPDASGKALSELRTQDYLNICYPNEKSWMEWDGMEKWDRTGRTRKECMGHIGVLCYKRVCYGHSRWDKGPVSLALLLSFPSYL